MQPGDITVILERVGRGQESSADRLLPLVYDELRKVAASKMAREAPGQTLQPTALVHEAWMRLGGDVMTEQGSGRRTFFHQRGANALLDATHFDFTRTSAKIFHLGYLLLLDRLDTPDGKGIPHSAQVLAKARAAGLATSVDLVSEDSNRFGPLVTPVLPNVDYLFANDFETERLTSVSLRRNGRIRAEAVCQAARKLVKCGVREWVIIHFPQAVYACNSGGEGVWQASLRVPENDIKGAAGAGDALAAGVLLGLHENWAMTDCLRLGVCAAAASLYHPTCSEGIVPMEACFALGRRLGYQSLPS